ncbi:MAG: hypothetical protein L6Q29_03470 [Candidatus Pacebacteria bacterium]|nr:hypothetical protein [Candidatus Paceibacterota bacterium]NUQ57516.1 hypothetical protein [Candidatus Paceibacter sp.]
MKIPKKVRINGFDWQVNFDANVAYAGDAFGSTHYHKQQIFLDPSETQQKKEQCLIHEAMHAIFWQTGLWERLKNIQGIKEEEIIQALSFGVYQFLRENKFLRD